MFNLTAKRTSDPKKDAFNPKHRKEYWRKKTYVVVGYIPAVDQVWEFVEVRIFSSPSGQSVFACVWVRHDPAGSGSASGYGYHKESYAAAKAFATAGFEFYKGAEKPTFLGGMGDTALQEMCIAVAQHIKKGMPAHLQDIKLSFHQF